MKTAFGITLFKNDKGVFVWDNLLESQRAGRKLNEEHGKIRITKSPGTVISSLLLYDIRQRKSCILVVEGNYAHERHFLSLSHCRYTAYSKINSCLSLFFIHPCHEVACEDCSFYKK